jgi:hypothetical protein
MVEVKKIQVNIGGNSVMKIYLNGKVISTRQIIVK